ncbi:hypothetical protein J2J97_32370 (plasmid) [Rhizobium bangladeshense]|uniref:DUF7338 family protein n=1 Tax=Rhizobium bangladeshense TaxID=1138189 RepID=UPI001A99AE95|nr:hypothetical protein [Rhizobium bangladeshense]QSY98601.1 hypothetical protein J2J97_32370 [Rhizobium bangladeshense]
MRLGTYLAYGILAVLSLMLVLAAWVLSPALAGLSVIFGVDSLPLGLQWFSTIDDTLDGGQHQHRDKYPPGATGFSLWWQRTCWICRNPAQGFQAYLFGFDMLDVFKRAQTETGISGKAPFTRWIVYERISNGAQFFSYQRNIPLLAGVYIKLWFGWAGKTSAQRYSLKCVPFSLGRYAT